MDQTGSEESKHPAGEGAASSGSSADEDHAANEHSGQEDGPEGARRAFDLLERFSGELEEILQSLERTRGSATPAEESPPAPESAYRPSSIHFDSSPISTRIDPYALPPVESPGATSRTAPRLLLEALFLILVAAISARADLRPLLIAVAEAVAFLIVASIEFSITRESRRFQRLPAAAPLLAASEARESEAPSRATSVTLDQVEPLVWRADRPEAGDEADWPLVARELPSETEEPEEGQEGVTEISTARKTEAGAVAEPVPAPETRAEENLESAPPIQAAEPEPEAELASPPEVSATEVEPVQPRRFHLFRHEEKAREDEVEPEAEAEAGLESRPETVAEEVELEAELKPEAAAPEVEAEIVAAPEAQPETDRESAPIVAVNPEHETKPESPPETLGEEVERERPRRFHLFRSEEPARDDEIEPEAELEAEQEAEETDVEPEAEVEPKAEPEAEADVASTPEVFAEEGEPERPRRFRLFRHEVDEPEFEPEAGLESTAEIPASVAKPERHGLSHLFEREERKPDVESELEVELESSTETPGDEVEPERPRRFHLFRHEEKALEAEMAFEVAAEPVVEPEAEVEPEADVEPGAELENSSETLGEEVAPAQSRRFRLFRSEAEEPETEPGADGQGDSSGGTSGQDPFEEPGRVVESADMAIEIDLPPEIELDEIERTLEDLGRREPGLRRRRWPLRTDADKDTAVQAVEEVTEDGESEVRFAAEQERRRREREYLRNLRVSR